MGLLARLGRAGLEQLVGQLHEPPAARVARQQRRQRRREAIMHRLARMVGGAAAIALLAFFWGLFIAPIGFSGVMLTMLAMAATFVALGFFPRVRSPADLPAQPLASLPAAVEDWLYRQRPALPPPAARQLDRIVVLIAGLAPGLKALERSDPRADTARRLLADHLPRLVQRYVDVPASHRADAQTHLSDGLTTVTAELERLSASLASERIGALEVEERFLDSRYGTVVPGKTGARRD